MEEGLRALPAAVFVPENTMKDIAMMVAKLLKSERKERQIVLVKAGRYKANTDQIVTYNHESNLPRQYPKADLVRSMVCLVSQIPNDALSKIGGYAVQDDFLGFLREHWDESLETDSPVTLLFCKNFKGPLVDYYANSLELSGRPSFKE